MASGMTHNVDGPLGARNPKSARWTFGLGSLLFMIAQIAFCLGILHESSFMGIFAFAIFIPACVRACRIAEKRRVLGVPIAFDERVTAYTGSVLVMSLAIFGSSTAFLVVTFSIGLTVGPFLGQTGGIIGVIAGLIAGGGMLVWLLRKCWAGGLKLREKITCA